MEHHKAVGTHLIAVSPSAISSAVSEVVRCIGPDQAAKLKVASGEHLAAILATAFLGAAPVSVDATGGPDLVFDIASRRTQFEALLGRADVDFADFEVKSLPGPYREFSAAIDRATAAGNEPEQKAFSAELDSANSVLRGVGQDMIKKAADQLRRKSHPGRSRNAFLISHELDHPIIESMDALPLLAHHLEPMQAVDGIDAIWVLFAPSSLVVWSAGLQRWTNLIYQTVDPDEDSGADEESFDLLQVVDMEFTKQTGSSAFSPFVYRFTKVEIEPRDS